MSEESKRITYSLGECDVTLTQWDNGHWQPTLVFYSDLKGCETAHEIDGCYNDSEWRARRQVMRVINRLSKRHGFAVR